MEVVDARPCRTKVKRRKAQAAGKPTRGGEALHSTRAACVLVTGWSRSLLLLTRGDLPGSAQAVNLRTKGRGLMTRQKSEDRVVPNSRRKSALTQGAQRRGGGKAIPVNQHRVSLDWPLEQQKTARRKPSRSSARWYGASPVLLRSRGRSHWS